MNVFDSRKSSEEIASLVDRMIVAWNLRNLPQLLSFLTEDVVWSDPGMSMEDGPATGKDAVEKFVEKVLRAFPDFHYQVNGALCISADGRMCAVPFRISATNLGPFEPPGFAPTNRCVEFEGVDMLEFRGEKISRIITLFNVVPVAEQLYSFRLRPAPGSITERILVWAQRLRARQLRRASITK